MSDGKLIFDDEYIKNKDTRKAFYPMRIILDSSKFSKYYNDNDFSFLLLFKANQILPGFYNKILYNEIKYSISLLQETEVTLSFLSASIDLASTNAKEFKNILEEFRICLQNFIYFLNIGSYYTAFAEFRKILEGLLWIKELQTDIKNINNDRLSESYNTLFRKYFPDMIPFWNKISKIAHPDQELIAFNINKYYNKPSPLNELLEYTKKFSKIIRDSINELFNFYEKNKYIKRYRNILKKLEIERKLSKIVDSDKFEDDLVFLPSDLQKKFENTVEKEDKNSIEKLMLNYFLGLITFCQECLLKPGYTKKEKFLNKNNKCIEHINKKFQTYENKQININEYFFNNSFISKFKEYDFLAEIQSRVISLLIYFYKKELTNKLNIAILKSYVEELLFSICLGKFEIYVFLAGFVKMIEINFEIKLEKEKEVEYFFTNFRHFQFKERIIYYNGDSNKISGTKSKFFEVIGYIFELLEKMLLIFLRTI